MDELLRGPHDLGAAEARPTLQERWESFAGALRERSAAVWRMVRPPLRAFRSWLERHPISPAVYLATAALVGVVAVVNTAYVPSYVLNLNGVNVGVVENPAIYEQVVNNVEARASRILGYDYILNHTATFSHALSAKGFDFASVGDLENYFFNDIGEIMKGYVLTVNGAVIGAADDEASLEELLADVAAPYCTEHTIEYGFVDPVEITSEYVTSEFELDLDCMLATLTENTTGETTYEVVKGDTYYNIARDNGMSLDELMALNPQASLNRLMIGDLLNVKKVVPYLSVYTVDNVNYHAAVDSPVEYVDDASLYIGDSRVVTQGAGGEALVNANITYVNGYETERAVMASITLSEPTATVIARGTTERPKTASTGVYKWPVSGVITSRFGYRSTGLTGASSYHKGIDIGGIARGTSIKAADGGKVTYAGSMSGYGNLVIITHDNGTKTYYAHNTSLCVKAGERVYQGQVIAKAGNTGVSYGVHCHFEIRINGVPVNPLNYLK